MEKKDHSPDDSTDGPIGWSDSLREAQEIADLEAGELLYERSLLEDEDGPLPN